MENASDASDRDPMTGVFEAFSNTCDMTSSEAFDRDPTATT